eukprot:3750803-Rhodomonas_salina.3
MGCAQGPSESVGAERGSLHVLFLFLLLFLAHETAWTDSDEFAREQGVVVGNATMNTTVSPSEHISAQRVDVSVLIGGLYECEVITSGAIDTVESYVDCLLPPGVGSDLEVELFVSPLPPSLGPTPSFLVTGKP